MNKFHFDPARKSTEIRPPAHYVMQDDIVFLVSFHKGVKRYDYAVWLYKPITLLDITDRAKLKQFPFPGVPGHPLHLLRKPR